MTAAEWSRVWATLSNRLQFKACVALEGEHEARRAMKQNRRAAKSSPAGAAWIERAIERQKDAARYRREAQRCGLFAIRAYDRAVAARLRADGEAAREEAPTP